MVSARHKGESFSPSSFIFNGLWLDQRALSRGGGLSFGSKGGDLSFGSNCAPDSGVPSNAFLLIFDTE
jgi:hypothetical protein